VARDITQQRKAEDNLIKYQSQLRALSSQLSLTEAKERKQIASELHDQIGHALVMIKMNLSKLADEQKDRSKENYILQTLELTEQVIQDIRSLTFELASPLLYELGLSPALEQLAEKMQDEHGIRISFRSDIGGSLPDIEVSVLLFQTVRELLFNVVKHAKASNVHISVTKDRDTLLIYVRDDGVGFDISNQTPENERKFGIGLFSARERLNYLGGNIKMESRPGKGTCATLTVPLVKNR
jgi:signal transduction histidine kinase